MLEVGLPENLEMFGFECCRGRVLVCNTDGPLRYGIDIFVGVWPNPGIYPILSYDKSNMTHSIVAVHAKHCVAVDVDGMLFSN